MKKLLGLGLILLMGYSTGFGQMIFNGDDTQKTLFGKARPSGAFVGFSVKPALVNGQESIFMGGSAAIALGEKVNLGVIGYGLVSDVGSNQFAMDGTEYFIEMGYGGFLFEPVFGSNRILHFTAPLILGAGVSALSKNRPWDFDYEYDEYTDPELFLVAEPALNAELNLFRFMRLSAGVGYRFIGETGIFNLTNTNLSGWTGNVTLKLGWF